MPEPKQRFQTTRLYFRMIGGWKDVWRSVYVRSAVILSIVLFPRWIQYGWWDDVLAITPSLLGMTLAGLAIIMAFGDREFHRMLQKEWTASKFTFYQTAVAVFVHYIVIETLALILALICKAYYPFPKVISSVVTLPDIAREILGCLGYAGWWFGYFFFIYATLLTIGAAFSVFQVASAYQSFLKNCDNEENKESPDRTT